MSRTILGMFRSMLKEPDVSRKIWGDLVATTAYTRNYVTRQKLFSDPTPNEVWFNTNPDVSHL